MYIHIYTIWRFGRIGCKQPTKECVYMCFFAPKQTVQLVIILNISQIHCTADFPFNSIILGIPIHLFYLIMFNLFLYFFPHEYSVFIRT